MHLHSMFVPQASYLTSHSHVYYSNSLPLILLLVFFLFFFAFVATTSSLSQMPSDISRNNLQHVNMYTFSALVYKKVTPHYHNKKKSL